MHENVKQGQAGKDKSKTITEQFKISTSMKQPTQVNVYLQTSRTRSLTLTRTRTEDCFWIRSIARVLWLANLVPLSMKGYKIKPINHHFETCEVLSLLFGQSETDLRKVKKPQKAPSVVCLIFMAIVG